MSRFYFLVLDEVHFFQCALSALIIRPIVNFASSFPGTYPPAVLRALRGALRLRAALRGAFLALRAGFLGICVK